MKVLVATGLVPFRRTRIDELAGGLVAALADRGHAAEALRVPYAAGVDDPVLTAVAARGLDVRLADAVIALSFPGHLVHHPRVVLWLSGLEAVDDPAGREALRGADAHAIRSARSVFATSSGAASELGGLAGRRIEQLAPPTGDWDRAIGRLLA